MRLDDSAEFKSEFHDGELFPMVAVTYAHARLSVTLGAVLDRHVRRGCEGAGGVRVRVDDRTIVSPDAVVICGTPAPRSNFVVNPQTVFEILSPSTEDHDRGGKFKLYQRLPSFEEYVLIAQDQPRVDVFRKQAPGQWSLQIIEGLDQTVQLSVTDAPFSLGELYRGITFEALA